MNNELTATQYAEIKSIVYNELYSMLPSIMVSYNHELPSQNMKVSRAKIDQLQVNVVNMNDVNVINLNSSGYIHAYSFAASAVSCEELRVRGLSKDKDGYSGYSSVKTIINDLRMQVDRLNHILSVLVEDKEKLEKHSQLAEIYHQYKVTEALLSDNEQSNA